MLTQIVWIVFVEGLKDYVRLTHVCRQFCAIRNCDLTRIIDVVSGDMSRARSDLQDKRAAEVFIGRNLTLVDVDIKRVTDNARIIGQTAPILVYHTLASEHFRGNRRRRCLQRARILDSKGAAKNLVVIEIQATADEVSHATLHFDCVVPIIVTLARIRKLAAVNGDSAMLSHVVKHLSNGISISGLCNC